MPDFTVIKSLLSFIGLLLLNSEQAEAPLSLDISNKTCLRQYYNVNSERHSLLLPDESDLGLHD